MTWIDKIVGDIGDKKRWREHKARITRLPAGYREAGNALERYLMYFGPNEDTTSFMAMLDDLDDLLEQSVAAGTPIRDIVGADPVDFAETFLENYGGGSWIRTERQRLVTAIARVEGEH
jgi:DNA-binding ferritin-like protein (Dps family)